MDDPEIAELFHQAERAFTAYVEAENNLDYRDIATVQRLYDQTSEAHREFLVSLEKERITAGIFMSGQYRVVSITPLGLDSYFAPILHVCLDVSEGQLVNSNGDPVYENASHSKVAKEITFSAVADEVPDESRVLIAGIHGYAGEVMCE